MRQIVKSLHEYFIPNRYKNNEQDYRKSRILVNTTLITAIFAIFFLGNTIMFKMPHAFIIMSICVVLFTLNAWLLRWGVSKNMVTHIYVLVATICSFGDCYFSGGLYSFNVVWFSLGAACAVLLSNSKIGWFWIIINTLIVLALGLMQMNGFQFPMEIDPNYTDFMYLNSYLGLLWIIFIIMLVMEKASLISLNRLQEKNIIIENEKKRSDELLQNILPTEVIDELKSTGHSKARLFNDVSVLFTDFVNFTQISENLNPEELVSEIDFCFKGFDEIVERNGLEKIKTIGDAYLAVCGLPHEDENHAINTVQAALEIMKFTNLRRAQGGKFEIRIGIHSGPLVAGIVGVKKFAYDIWGDTVNTASRMESSGEEGKINISNTTYELIKDKFNCVSRGEIEAKNKGMIKMYFVESTIKN